MAIKKSVLALCLCLCLCLVGCGIKGEVYEKTPHTTVPQGQVPNDMTVVTTYNSLKNELKSIVSAGVSTVKLAVVDYWGNIDMDLQEIIQSITVEDAVGSFAVSSIMYEQARAPGYHQVSIVVQYKRTQEEIQSIVSVTDDQDFEGKLREMFSNFRMKRAFKVATKKTDDEVYSQILKAYYSLPSSAIGLKTLKVTPTKGDTNPQVIEVEAEYIWELEKLQEMQKKISMVVEELCSSKRELDVDGKISFITEYVAENMRLNQEAMLVVAETADTQPKSEVYTAYGAVVDGVASQSGITLGVEAMCNSLGIENRIIVGQRNGAPHMWLIIRRGEVWQHFDATRTRAEGYVISATALAQEYKYNPTIFGIS